MPRYMNLYLSKQTEQDLNTLVERWGLGDRGRGRAIALALALAAKSKK